jgi:uncharacterized OB-fold protein
MSLVPPQASTSLADALRRHVGTELLPPRRSPDGVNPAMIRHWCLAIGDTNPRYAPGPAQIAPPAMLQAWCMRELDPAPADGPMAEIDALLEQHGYSAVVATNCEQSYQRDLRPGEVPVETRVLESVSEEKRTALGPGFFLTVRMDFTVDDETVATMRFRTLRYRPQAGNETAPITRPGGLTVTPAGRRPRPATNEDNQFFFDGAARGELLIRSCTACGRDQHPPLPMCPACGGLTWTARAVPGTGTVYTFTVTSHPQFPGFTSPFVVALVELSCGARLVTNLIDVDPAEVSIGMPVEVAYIAVDDDLTLPLFRPAAAGPSQVGAA